jgi:hypothetical protein
MKTGLILLMLFAAPESLVQQIADSGRCADLAESPDQRVCSSMYRAQRAPVALCAIQPMIAPGPPPLISFRYYEGKQHHRFGNAELMLDDAGH